MSKRTCNLKSCAVDATARGLCNVHYHRWRRGADLPASEPIATFQSFEDAFQAHTYRTPKGCLRWNSSLDGNGYGQIRFKGERMPAHRYAYERANGPIPDGLLIDHKCHNIICCEVSHLRLATQKQNLEHRAGANKNNRSSGVRGVVKHGSGWRAQVEHHGKTIRGGTFRTISEAETAVTALRVDVFTHNLLDRKAS